MNNLTAYQLRCGYVQTSTINIDHLFQFRGQIYAEHNSYHVRFFKEVKNSSSCDRLCWEVFDKVSDARLFFKTKIKELKDNTLGEL